MTKSDFIEQLSSKHNIPRNDADRIFSAFLDGLEDGLYKDGIVNLPGFGIFKTSLRKERAGHNPRTGEPITIAEQKTITFKPAQKLKDLIKL